jgi:tetratricopeptide (TPR) repeat protein
VGAADQADTGHRIGAYRLLRVLGSGGMGSVWLAERADQQFDQRVAIKLIRRGMDTDELLHRFRRERQLLAGLNHPNIARLLDGGATEDGRPFFVMEYVDGTPIDCWCDDHRLSIAQRLALFRRVCAAVQHAHQSLIVHRDLKPANILIDPAGEPKLLDFGIARVLASESAAPEVTLAESRRLTPAYASPELMRGEPITTATDVYALGVILYELLAGQRPYALHTTSAARMEEVICQQQPLRPSAAVAAVAAGLPSAASDTARRRSADHRRLRRQLAGDLDTIVLTALRKEPQRRYGSVEALAEDVRRHVEGMPIVARPDSLAYRASKFVRRNAVAVAASAVTLAGLLAATIVSVNLYLRADDARRLAEQAETRANRDLVRQRAVRAFLSQIIVHLPPGDDEGESSSLAALEALDQRIANLDGGKVRLESGVEAAVRASAAELYRHLDQRDRAIAQFEAALRALQRDDAATWDMAETLALLGQTRLEHGQPELASRDLAQSLEIQQRLGSAVNLMVSTRLSLVAALLELDRLAEAERHLQIAEAGADRFYQPVAARCRAELERRQREPSP